MKYNPDWHDKSDRKCYKHQDELCPAVIDRQTGESRPGCINFCWITDELLYTPLPAGHDIPRQHRGLK